MCKYQLFGAYQVVLIGVETSSDVLTQCCVLIFLASEGGCPSSAQGRDLESMAEARIDIKKLQHLLAGQQVNPTKALCSKFNSSAHKLQIRRGVCCTCSLSRTAYLLFFCLKLFTVPEDF